MSGSLVHDRPGSLLARETREIVVRDDAAHPLVPGEDDEPSGRAPRRQGTAAARAEKDDPGVVASVVKSSAFRSMLRSAGTVIGREITRSVFGNSRRR